MAEPTLPAHDLAGTVLKGECPRCGASGLFEGWVRFASRCRACGLDYDSFNVGDGPAAFLILFVGAVVTDRPRADIP